MKSNVLVALGAALLVACGADTAKFTGNWIQVVPENPQLVQGVRLNDDGSASSIGMATLQYETWETANKQLILTGKSIGNGQTIAFSDTMNIVLLTADSLILGSGDSYRRTYIKVVDPNNVKPFNVLDSLKILPELGDVETRYFQGIIPAADCPGIDCKVWLYNQKNSGDGVYKLDMTYLEAENGKDMTSTSFGRQYTLRGNATDQNATVYQFFDFGSTNPMSFLVLDNGKSIEMLGADQVRIDNGLNYTLTLQ